jgi:hypothetical protein
VKKKAIALMLMLVLSISSMVVVQTVKAQNTPIGEGVTYFESNIISPTNGSIYTVSLVTINLTAFVRGSNTVPVFMDYSLDGTSNGSIPVESCPSPFDFPPFLMEWCNGSANLQLSQGTHILIVITGIYSIQLNKTTIYFTVNLGNPPVISNLSIENKTYATNNLTLNFTTNVPTSWIGYNIDRQANVTLAGNTTLTELSYGSHSITVYANDTLGNMGIQTITFTIAKPESFPSATVAAVSGAVAVVVVVAGLLVYFKKRKH